MCCKTYSQDTTKTHTITSKETYLQRRNVQSVVAWTLLAGGIVTAGTVKSNQSTLQSRLSRTGLGLLAITCSIPFFIIANRNKTKANAISAYWKVEESAPNPTAYSAVKLIPGLSIRWKL
jgi:hypothetical protein